MKIVGDGGGYFGGVHNASQVSKFKPHTREMPIVISFGPVSDYLSEKPPLKPEEFFVDNGSSNLTIQASESWICLLSLGSPAAI
jgi:hypothetical protein